MPAAFRPRVLVIAEAANPEWVSVPLVGWSLATALRRVADVHLVTQIRNREAILRAGLREGEDFTAIDTEAVARPVYALASRLRMGKGRGWTVVTGLASLFAYPHFERLVWQTFRARLHAGDYDIVHRITPLTPTANSTLAPRCARLGIPFVLGPLNGGVPWPPGFERARWQEREWLSYLRGLYRFSPRRGQMLRATAAIIAGSRQTASEVPQRFHDRLTRIPENAIDPSRFTAAAVHPGSLPLTACFLGRLVPYKGADMLIEAAQPHLAAGRLRLEIVGDGPVAGALRRQAADAGVAEAVRFHGWLPHQRVQEVLAASQVFAFPSIREFGGGVVLEAMAVGVVPMICDYAGPAELVDAQTAIRIPLGRRAEIVAGFREALGRVLDDPGCLVPMAEAGRRRVAELFTWDRKADQILDIYRWALKPEGPIPRPFGP